MVRRDTSDPVAPVEPVVQPAGGTDYAALFLEAMNKNSGGVDPNDPPVYLGSSPARARLNPQVRVPGQMSTDEGAVIRGPRTVGLSTAKAEFYNWTQKRRDEWGTYLASIGYIDEADAGDYRTQLETWFEVVEQGAGFTAAGKEYSPRQIARWIAGTKPPTVEDGPFTGTRSTTSTSVDLTDPETVKALVNKTLSDTLGRAANPEELRALGAVLTRAEQSSPTSTSTTTTYDADVPTAQSSVTSGGLSAQGRDQVLTERAMAKPEYGAYQSATTYFDALTSAIQSPV